MARVALEHVRKTYDNGFVAVHDATFEIEDGEFIVLVGPSGCGKSTTLRMIAGLESITGGILQIGGRVVNDAAPKDRDVAMVFQNYALYPHMDVFDNMAFGLKLRKYPRAEIDSRVHQAAAILGLEGVLDRKPKQLSGGQRQRVALGRAIVRKPQVFLFDEPLSNLDAKLRVQTRTEIAKLHRKLGATMVYVTHDQVEAMTMGDRIVVMLNGRIQQIARPLELYERPANRFVAGFIGSPSMNFLEVEVGGSPAGGLSLHGYGLTFPVPAAYTSALAPHIGSQVTLGIRPEHLHVASSVPAHNRSAVLSLRLDAVEPMGNEVFLYAGHSRLNVVARVAPQPLPDPEEPIDLILDLDHLHFFAPDTGVSISV